MQRFIFENTRTKFLLCSPLTLPEPDAVPDNVRGLGRRRGCPGLYCQRVIYTLQVVVILIDVTTLAILHPSLPPLPCTARIAPWSCLTEQQLAGMTLADMQALLALGLNGRSTQPTDTGTVHTFFTLLTCLTRFSSAYYIHTSGSTGKPKCVVHCHSSLDWHSHMTLLGSGLTCVDDTCLQVADCSFDLHIRDIFCFLSTGAHVVTIPQGNRMARYLKRT